ncbi:hypothetical protein [Actinomadura monticuli]|uniref:Zinc-binding dehydrogenase n=1 Tax=Actinomadura monticuli TaxID=3097367 RepID=A0ABV4Q4P7_9ACTN
MRPFPESRSATTSASRSGRASASGVSVACRIARRFLAASARSGPDTSLRARPCSFSSGRLTASVHARIPLDEAPEAHRILDARANLGRVLLVP